MPLLACGHTQELQDSNQRASEQARNQGFQPKPMNSGNQGQNAGVPEFDTDLEVFELQSTRIESALTSGLFSKTLERNALLSEMSRLGSLHRIQTLDVSSRVLKLDDHKWIVVLPLKVPLPVSFETVADNGTLDLGPSISSSSVARLPSQEVLVEPGFSQAQLMHSYENLKGGGRALIMVSTPHLHDQPLEKTDITGLAP